MFIPLLLCFVMHWYNCKNGYIFQYNFALQSQFSTPQSPQSLPLSPYPLSPFSYIIIIIIIIITSQYKLQEIKHIMIHVYDNRFKSSIGGQPRSSLDSQKKENYREEKLGVGGEERHLLLNSQSKTHLLSHLTCTPLKIQP